MNTSLKGRDWLMTQDWSVEEIETALDTADQLKADFRNGVPTLELAHKTAFLIFFDKSTRTRNAFEAGMTQLGGHAHFLDADVTQISHGETPADTGKILAAMGHGICVRHDLILGQGDRPGQQGPPAGRFRRAEQGLQIRPGFGETPPHHQLARREQSQRLGLRLVFERRRPARSRALDRARGHPAVLPVQQADDELLEVAVEEALLAGDLEVEDVSIQRPNLQSVFISLTGKELRD